MLKRRHGARWAIALGTLSGSFVAGACGGGGSGVDAGSGGSQATGGSTVGSGGSTPMGGDTGSGGSAQTSGCAGPLGDTGVQNLTLDVGGTARSYVLSVPESVSADTPITLVFAWHGLGGSGTLARLYFGVEEEADGAAIFVYPDGLPVESQGGEPGWDLAADGIDVAFFDALLADLSGRYCIDDDRIFSTGHSFGGYMTNRLGCSRADVLRGVAPVAGGPAFGGTCGGEIAALLVHGTNDPTVEITQGMDARDAYLAASGCSMTSAPTPPAPCAAYDGCSSASPVVWCEHDTEEGDAHGWPDFAATAIWGFLSSLD